ncbi:hypothetical protein CEXT_92701 [Caerostris extrusa]|uniref:Uncharacterized protein n=1 Tax=Caerostris extrusa TaxID=172846 RepID=A0AAV4PDL2_CAEEX|nr:hypothetical protein CEXT_92701 [Caerostris extrusa]
MVTYFMASETRLLDNAPTSLFMRLSSTKDLFMQEGRRFWVPGCLPGVVRYRESGLGVFEEGIWYYCKCAKRSLPWLSDILFPLRETYLRPITTGHCGFGRWNIIFPQEMGKLCWVFCGLMRCVLVTVV